MVYWTKVGIGTRASMAEASRGPTLFGVRVFSLGLAGCSSLLKLTVLDRTFL